MKRRVLAVGITALAVLVAAQAWRFGMSAGRIESARALEDSTTAQLPAVYAAGDGGDIAPSDAAPIVVLGAAIWGPTTPSRYLELRLQAARELWTPGRVVIVSGDGRDETWSETAVMRQWLTDHGVANEDIVDDPLGLDTVATCRFVAEHYPGRQAILVTQSYHLPRAISLCRSVGVDTYGWADEGGRAYGSTWRYGVLREIPATYKAAVEGLGEYIRRIGR